MINNLSYTRFMRIMLCLLSIIMLATAVPVSVNAVYYDKADYDDIKTEDLEAMREQLKEYEAVLEGIKDDLKKAGELQADAEEKRNLYLAADAIYKDQLKELEKAQLYYENEIEKTGKEVAALRIEYDNAYETFLELLRMTYEAGSANYLEILLGAESFTDLLARIDRVSGLIRYSDTIMKKLDSQRSELDTKHAQLIEASDKQAKAIDALEAKQSEIAAWRVENEAALKEIAAEIERLTGDKGEYESLEDILEEDFDKAVDAAIAAENKRREEIAIEKEREEERKQQEALAEAVRKQKFLWPLPVSWDYISYDYGYRTIPELGYYNKFHYGIDMPAYRGTEIYASKAGRVLISKYHTSYGFYVLLDHGNGQQSLYAHCSKLIVKAGDYVDQGQAIALVGSTGTSTGNHLHYEVRIDGKRVDPLDYVIRP